MITVMPVMTWIGLSTDTKPTTTSEAQEMGLGNLKNGQPFLEADTGKVLTWNADGAAWAEIGGV